MWAPGTPRSVLPSAPAQGGAPGGLSALIESVADEPIEVRRYVEVAFQEASKIVARNDLYSRDGIATAILDHVRSERAQLLAEAQSNQEAGYEKITDQTPSRTASMIRAKRKRDAEILAGNFPTSGFSNILLSTNFSPCLDQEKARAFGRARAMQMLEGGLGQGLDDAQKKRIAEKVSVQVLDYFLNQKQIVQSHKVQGAISGWVLQAKRGG